MKSGRVQVLKGHWYDYPQYYDMLFRKGTAEEVEFLCRIARRYTDGRDTRWLDLGCGSGRIARALAARGKQVVALDAHPAMVAYTRARLAPFPRSQVIQADICSFRLRQPIDVAVCSLDTFRHVIREAEARRHLRAVWRALRFGGIYILAFHVLPLDVAEEAEERWSGRRGKLKVTGRLRVVAMDRRRRLEKWSITLWVHRRDRTLKIESTEWMRLYTVQQVTRLLKSAGQWELLGAYDFRFDSARPRRLDDDLVDAVFVLRKVKRQSGQYG